MPETSISTPVKQLATVIVPVSDQDRALDFYVEQLGFEKRLDVPMGGESNMRWIEVAPPGAATTVAIVPPREGEATGIETRIAFSCEDIDATHAELSARGVDVDDVVRMGDPVPPMFFLRDIDANRLLIVQLS